MLGSDHSLDVAAHVEVADDLHLPGIQKLDQIIHDSIRNILVKDLLIAETVDVELKRFKLYTPLVRNILDMDCSEVRESTAWTNAGEFGTMKLD